MPTPKRILIIDRRRSKLTWILGSGVLKGVRGSGDVPERAEVIPQLIHQVVSRDRDQASALNQTQGFLVSDLTSYNQNSSHEAGTNLQNA
jgi:RNA polymerase-interacting CarD/CdnL/TRCF family regulator